jgi:translation initiation factor 2 beta subunit (eIF-2beta)/eIF-5
MRGDPDQEAASWLEKLSEVEQERRGYLRFAAKGHMTDEELDEALAELEEIRMMAEDELAIIRGRKEILEELERDRDALLESYAEMTPEGLDALTPEERRQVHGMLRLRVEVATDGTMEAQGILSKDWRPACSDGLCGNGLASQHAPV